MLRDFIAEDRDHFVRFAKTFYSSDATMYAVPEQNFHTTFDQIMQGSPFLRGMMFVCEGQPVGYALLSFTFSAEAGGMVVLLEEAYILPDFQGRGLGTELFRMVEREYAGKARRLRLEVTRSNTDAVRLYERMGFQPLDYIQMIKDLPE